MKSALIVSAAFLVGLGIVLVFIPKTLPSSYTAQPIPTPFVAPTPTPLPTPTVIGWMAYWDETVAYERLGEMIEKLDVFSPMLYRIGPSGALSAYTIRTKAQALALARNNGIPLLPTIGDDGDEARVKLLLTDNAVQDLFTNDLITEAASQGFIGWAIDIEMLGATDEVDFTRLVKKIGDALHANGLLFHVIVYGRVQNESYPPAKAHNYQAIGEIADKVILMTYNYNNELTGPGPQTPPDWLRSSLTYATAVIPKEKIVVGLSTHGYSWSEDKVTGLTYPEAISLLSRLDALGDLDEHAMAMVARTDETTVWYETHESIWQKIHLVRDEFGINEFALWRIGADDKVVWQGF